MERKTYNWDVIQEYLAENDQAGLLMAVLEADKILFSVLQDLGYPGNSAKKKLLSAKKLFSDFNRLKKAHAISQKIRRELNFSLSPKFTEEILAVYYQALLNIKEAKKPRFSLRQKVFLLIQKKIQKLRRLIKWAGIYVIVLLFIILFLDKTKTGNRIVALALKITDFIFSWFLILVFLLLGALITTLGTLWYLKERRKVKMDLDISDREHSIK